MNRMTPAVSISDTEIWEKNKRFIVSAATCMVKAKWCSKKWECACFHRSMKFHVICHSSALCGFIFSVSGIQIN